MSSPRFPKIISSRVRCALIAAGLAACSPTGDGPRNPDIVLVSIDTLRADRLGCYGATNETSPAIDRLAATGVRFDQAFAATSWTLPSHVTLLTGQSMASHRVVDMTDRIDPARGLLADHLRMQGYATAAFVSAPFLHRAYGFDRGFGTYRNLGTSERVAGGVPSAAAHEASHADRTADRVIDQAIHWLESSGASERGPVFLFVHLWDPHFDFDPPPPFDTRFDPDYAGDLDVRNFGRNPDLHPGMSPRDLEHLIALYDGEIAWTDSQVGRLLDAVARRAESRPTIVSLVSDHGEEFFEHGRKGHMKTLFEESVRIPWILRYPGRIPAGRVVEGVAALEDVAPTLLELARVPALPESTGVSRVPEITGSGANDRPALLVLGDGAALRGDAWKVVLPASGAALYFDLARDPGERAGRPASRAAPGALADLEKRLASDRLHASSLVWTGQAPVDLDDETRARLRELGYLDSEGD